MVRVIICIVRDNQQPNYPESLKKIISSAVVLHAFNPSTWEAEKDKSQ